MPRRKGRMIAIVAVLEKEKVENLLNRDFRRCFDGWPGFARRN